MNAQIYEIAYWVDAYEPKELKKALDAIINQANFTCLGFIDNTFSPQGYTGLWLLAESHLAVHTFPEEAKSYVQLSCCSEAKYQAFLSLFQQQFTIINQFL